MAPAEDIDMTKTRFAFPLLSGLVLLVAACAPEMESPDELDTEDSIEALTNPVACAVAKPSAFKITPPWAPGVSHQILQGYGSGLHQYACRSNGSNDYFALDFNLALGEAVMPIADGTILYAGPATGGWSGYGNIVFVEHIINGVRYQSLYAHLNSVEVLKGQAVKRNTRIGGAGNSGTSAVHLHLAVYRGALLQEIVGSTGPYGGAAMVPEAFTKCTKSGGACENLVSGDVLLREATTTSSSPYPNCPCDRTDNYCHHAPQTNGCPMTFPGGYCDPNGDGSYADGDWTRGYNEYQSYCN